MLDAPVFANLTNMKCPFVFYEIPVPIYMMDQDRAAAAASK